MQRSIAYGYLPTYLTQLGQQVEIELMGSKYKATVVPEPLVEIEAARVRRQAQEKKAIQSWQVLMWLGWIVYCSLPSRISIFSGIILKELFEPRISTWYPRNSDLAWTLLALSKGLCTSKKSYLKNDLYIGWSIFYWLQCCIWQFIFFVILVVSLVQKLIFDC